MDAEEYHRMAAVEDQMWFYRALHRHIAQALPTLVPRGPAEILDAGCGTGGLIRRLSISNPDWQWTGVDVDSLACELARRRCRGKIVQASVDRLPFVDGAFAAVVCADVLYHLDDDEAALRELFRVTRPGGGVVINVPAHRWLWSYHDVAVQGRRRYERTDLKSKLQAAGFERIVASHWNTLPLPLIAVRRKLFSPPKSGSDVRLYPPVVESVLNGAMAVERWWLQSGGTFPVGSSILAVGHKS